MVRLQLLRPVVQSDHPLLVPRSETLPRPISRFVNDLFGGFSESFIPIVVLITGMLVAIIVGRLSRRILKSVGLSDIVEGTRFERTMNRIGSSTVHMLSLLITLFVIAMAVGIALSIQGVLVSGFILSGLPTYLLQVFVAALVLIIGLVTADKVEVDLQERFEDVKLPEVNLITGFVKYTILFVVSLVALAQLGIQTGPLLVLFGGYVFACVVLGAVALKDLLAAGSAGIYLLLNEPYVIGDTVEIDGKRGIVQEVDVFVTHVESDSEEYIVPNHLVLHNGIVRVRS